MKKRITQKQSIALPFLASGLSGAETAKLVGVKPSTVSEWLHHCPDFIDALEELRTAAMHQAMMRLQGTISLAIDELRTIMSTSKTDAVRLKAALFIIENCGISTARNDSLIDPASRAELAAIGDALKSLGGHNA